MLRKLRIEYPGAMYHVMNREDEREDKLRLQRIERDRQGYGVFFTCDWDWGGKEGGLNCSFCWP
jgi:hypothetical protein